MLGAPPLLARPRAQTRTRPSTHSGVKEEANTVVVQTQGVLDSATSKLSVTYGKQIPLDPPIVFEQVRALLAYSRAGA